MDSRATPLVPWLTLAVLWIALCGGTAVTLWSSRITDGAAPFLVVMLVLQAPAFAALATARDAAPLGTGRSVAIAIPAGIVGAFMAFFLVGHAFARVVPNPETIVVVPVILATVLLACRRRPSSDPPIARVVR